jgi:hypothetical protein
MSVDIRAMPPRESLGPKGKRFEWVSLVWRMVRIFWSQCRKGRAAKKAKSTKTLKNLWLMQSPPTLRFFYSQKRKGKFNLKKQIAMMPCFHAKNIIWSPHNVKEKVQILRRIFRSALGDGNGYGAIPRLKNLGSFS